LIGDGESCDSIAIGGATKAKIEEFGGRVIFSPKKFYGKTLAKDILERFKDRKILYLRPKVSLLIVNLLRKKWSIHKRADHI